MYPCRYECKRHSLKSVTLLGVPNSPIPKAQSPNPSPAALAPRPLGGRSARPLGTMPVNLGALLPVLLPRAAAWAEAQSGIVLAGGVAHFAHLGGMIGGFAMLRYWRGPGGWRRVIRQRKHSGPLAAAPPVAARRAVRAAGDLLGQSMKLVLIIAILLAVDKVVGQEILAPMDEVFGKSAPAEATKKCKVERRGPIQCFELEARKALDYCSANARSQLNGVKMNYISDEQAFATMLKCANLSKAYVRYFYDAASPSASKKPATLTALKDALVKIQVALDSYVPRPQEITLNYNRRTSQAETAVDEALKRLMIE